MEAIEKELLEDLNIYYSKKYGFYGKAILNIDGYEVTVKTDYFDVIDSAVTAIKEKVSEAVVRFNKPQ